LIKKVDNPINEILSLAKSKMNLDRF